ncbi:MAG: HD domain-containing protein [Firmicutes bacterium]|nr:HD domain-containing protein [Bacillota bacterium]
MMFMKDKLYEILMVDDVVDSINSNIDVLLEMIPEIEDMIGFQHNHPHHHLDVWKHTLLALSLSKLDFDTRIVLLLHDIGKPFSYQDDEVRHFHGHADVSSNMSVGIFNRLGFNSEEVDELTYLIREHDTEITKEDIDTNIDLCIKRFGIQFCDALAHNPTKLKKRIEYLVKLSKELGVDKDTHYVKRLEKY